MATELKFKVGDKVKYVMQEKYNALQFEGTKVIESIYNKGYVRYTIGKYAYMEGELENAEDHTASFII